MVCGNCPENFDADVCITVSPIGKPELFYGVEFLGLDQNFQTNTTTASYRVCNCNPSNATGSGISHINFEICPIGPGPDVNLDATEEANKGIVDNVEILVPGKEFNFRAVKLEFDPSVEPTKCVVVKIVYNGLFNATQEGQVGVKIGGGSFNVPTTANSANGLPLLLVCEPQCPSTCEFVCENEGEDTVDIECELVVPESECLTVFDTVQRLNYCVEIAAPVLATCESTAYIPTCDGGMLECCVTVPYILFPSIKVEVLYGVDAQFDGCEGETPLTLPCVSQFEFTNQYCFYCPGTDVSKIIECLNECDLIAFEEDPDLNDKNVIMDTAFFVCPEE